MGYFAAQGSSYEWNVGLNGHRTDETWTTNLFLPVVHNGVQLSTNLMFLLQTTPLLLDYEEFHPRPAKSGKNVVYMDNHVAPLDISSNPAPAP